jgi:putative cell wall-binding protein
MRSRTKSLVLAAVLVGALVIAAEPASAVTVRRIGGADRYATAAMVSQASFSPGVSVAFVATGANYPDALAGGPAAAKGRGPVLLTRAGDLPQPTADELSRLQPASIVVLGGQAAVSAGVEQRLATYTQGSVTRIAGGDRFESAALVSAQRFTPGVPVAYVATGGSFPDALAGGPAAGMTGGPILLTQPSALPDVTAAELERLQPARIVILGGTGAVGAAVETSLRDYAPTVSRFAGGDRFATSVAVSEGTFSPGVPRVFIATGTDFPDALAAGPAGGIAPGPILLSRRDCVPSAVYDEVTRLDPAEIIILGGTAVLAPSVEAGYVCDDEPTGGGGGGGGGGSTEDDTIPGSDPASGFHVIYAVPSDQQFDATVPDAIRHELKMVSDWFAGQTGGPRPALDREAGGTRVQIDQVKLTKTRAEIDAGGTTAIKDEIRASTPQYFRPLVYVDADAIESNGGRACGENADGLVVLWMPACDIYPDATATALQYGAGYLAAHEMVHAYGAVLSCAPHHYQGHVNDDRRDVLYQGPESRDWANLTLDVNRDDYFKHGRSDCHDIASASALWDRPF